MALAGALPRLDRLLGSQCAVIWACPTWPSCAKTGLRKRRPLVALPDQPGALGKTMTEQAVHSSEVSGMRNRSGCNVAPQAGESTTSAGVWPVVESDAFGRGLQVAAKIGGRPRDRVVGQGARVAASGAPHMALHP